MCPIGYDRSVEVKTAADRLHDELAALGIDVILDDRGERPGAMFADWELIGVPYRVVISDRGLKEGQLESRVAARPRLRACRQAKSAASLKAKLGAMIRRRGVLAFGLMPLAPRPALAGAQVEEPLADAVRSALAMAIANAAPPRPAFDSMEDRLRFLRWLGATSERLKRYKAST